MAAGGATGVIQMWLAGLLGLGGLYLVATHGSGLARALKGGEQFVAGTEGTVLRGGH